MSEPTPDVDVPPDPLDPEDFDEHFVFVKPLILERWPTIPPRALAATGGDVEAVIDLIALHVDRRELVRTQLAALLAEARDDDPGFTGRLRKAVRRLELQTQDIAQRTEHKAEVAVTEHLWRNLLITLGAGLLFGFVFGFTQRS